MSTALILNKDIYLDEKGRSVWADEFGKYCRQRLESSMATFLEEWFYDTTQGIPYFQKIFVRVKPKNIKWVADNILKRHIETRTYVKILLDFQSSLNVKTRVYTFSFSVILTNNEQLSLPETTLGI